MRCTLPRSPWTLLSPPAIDKFQVTANPLPSTETSAHSDAGMRCASLSRPWTALLPLQSSQVTANPDGTDVSETARVAAVLQRARDPNAAVSAMASTAPGHVLDALHHRSQLHPRSQQSHRQTVNALTGAWTCCAFSDVLHIPPLALDPDNTASNRKLQVTPHPSPSTVASAHSAAWRRYASLSCPWTARPSLPR